MFRKLHIAVTSDGIGRGVAGGRGMQGPGSEYSLWFSASKLRTVGAREGLEQKREVL